MPEYGKQEKPRGGDDLNEEQIKNIVTQVLAGEREKGQLSQEMGELRKGIKDANEGLAGLKGLFCNEDGTICFPTQVELNAYLEKQVTQAKELDSKMSTVIEKVKSIEATRKEEAEKLPRKPTKKWDNMTPEERTATVHDLDSLGFPHSAHYEVMKGCSDNPAEEGKEKCNILGRTLKDYPVEEIFAELPAETRGKVILLGCEDGACRVQLGDKIRIYKQDPKGRWKWIDEPPEDKGSHF